MIMVGLWEVTGSRGRIPPEEHQCPPERPETSPPALWGNKETLATCNWEEGPPPKLIMLGLTSDFQSCNWEKYFPAVNRPPTWVLCYRSENWQTCRVTQQIHLWGHILKIKSRISKRCFHPHVHRSIIHNSLEEGTTNMPTKRWLHK